MRSPDLSASGMLICAGLLGTLVNAHPQAVAPQAVGPPGSPPHVVCPLWEGYCQGSANDLVRMEGGSVGPGIDYCSNYCRTVTGGQIAINASEEMFFAILPTIEDASETRETDIDLVAVPDDPFWCNTVCNNFANGMRSSVNLRQLILAAGVGVMKGLCLTLCNSDGWRS